MAHRVTFANAGALLWLIPLAGAIILLYLLKMRRKDLRVPATFLWPAMTYEVRANSLFQRLRFSWLMILQLLAICLIILGLARPQIRQAGLGGEVTVIVLDTSASMSATDVTPSRFEQAVRAATTIVDAVKPGDRVALIESGPS
ncbi:MAG TPA: BatA and WFA domain-containing protein, partial [Fimbriimonadaceae bacterium]|nr:BatA and WFA domain-containing protein [Fimbriimonadaceae bacterium]